MNPIVQMIVKRLALKLVKKIAKETDNEIDDEIVACIEKLLNGEIFSDNEVDQIVKAAKGAKRRFHPKRK